MKFRDVNIEWLGHASFRITGSKTIYIDPYKINTTEKADIILITHSHYDHLSLEDINKIQRDETLIIATADSAEKLSGDVRVIAPGEKLKIDAISIEAVPAYNIDKNFHPKEKGWVGYVISIGGQIIYHAGDTDVIPEMDEIKADIALLPIGGTYTMNPGEAAEAATKIDSTYAIPMHFGSIVGDRSDAEKFSEVCDCEVIILEKV